MRMKTIYDSWLLMEVSDWLNTVYEWTLVLRIYTKSDLENCL